MQAIALAHLFHGQPAQQVGQLTEGTTRHQFVRTGFDNLGGNLKVAGQYRMAHRLVDMALLKQPVPSHRVEFFLFFFGLTTEVVTQYLAQ
ncbi:hypothetical protein D3C71_1177490 [compost metagenome]